MRDFSDVLLILLGWLLGTLSPGLGRAILRGYRRRELKAGFAKECVELRFTLAAALHLYRSNRRELDEATVALVKPIFLSYPGVDDRELVDSLRELLSKPSAEVVKVLNERPPKANSGAWPMPYELPLLEAHLGELTLLTVVNQEQLMRIRAELQLFNEQVAYVRRLIDRTFEAQGENHAINAANLVVGERNLAVRSAALIRSLNRFLADES